MPSLDYVPPLDMMLDYQQQTQLDQTQSYPKPSTPPYQQLLPPSPEYPDSSYICQSSPYPQEAATDMYRHPSPVGSYHSVSPFNYTAVATQQQTQFSTEFAAQFQHHPSMIGSTASNLSSCAETSAAAAQQHSPVSSWPAVSSSLPGYPSSPATGGSEWTTYQPSDTFPNNSSAVFPTITGTSTACAMAGAIPTFEDFTTGYPTVPAQMFPSQQGMMSLDRQMRCSYEWAKASSTYRVNPQTGKIVRTLH